MNNEPKTPYENADGTEYEVPTYRTKPGQSASALAIQLGGVIPARRDGYAAIANGTVIAAILESGITFPVVAK